jgi:hypothetical protein
MEAKLVAIQGTLAGRYVECRRLAQSRDGFTTVSAVSIERFHTPVEIAHTRYWGDMGSLPWCLSAARFHYTAYSVPTLTMRVFAGYASTYCSI